MPDDEINPEALARQVIDAKLVEAGWVVPDRAELNVTAALIQQWRPRAPIQKAPDTDKAHTTVAVWQVNGTRLEL